MRVNGLLRGFLALSVALALGACGTVVGVPVALQVLSGLAAASTIAKNEANCSLVDLAACTWPHFSAPAVVAP